MTNLHNKVRAIHAKLNVLNKVTRKRGNVKRNNNSKNNNNNILNPAANLLANNNNTKLAERLKAMTDVTDDYPAAPGWKIYKDNANKIFSLEPGTNKLLKGYPSSRAPNNSNLKEGWETWTSIESDGDHKTFYYNPNSNASTYNKPTKNAPAASGNNNNNSLNPSANLLANNNNTKLSERIKNMTDVTDDYPAAPGWKIYKSKNNKIHSLEPGTNKLLNGYPSSRAPNNTNLKEGWETWTSIEHDGAHKTFYYNPNSNSSTYNKPTKNGAAPQSTGNIVLEGTADSHFASQFASTAVDAIKQVDPSVGELVFDITNKSHKQLVNYLNSLEGRKFKLTKPTKETDGYWNAAPGSELYKLYQSQPSKKSSYRGKVWELDPTPSGPYTEIRLIAVPSGDKTYITYSMYSVTMDSKKPQTGGGIPSSQTSYVFGLELSARGGKRKTRRQSRK